MRKTIASLEGQLRALRKQYRELLDCYNKYYYDVTIPNKKELWFYSEPMGDNTTRELFLSVHSAAVLGYDCVLTAVGACTPDKKLNVTFVKKRPASKPMPLILANYA